MIKFHFYLESRNTISKTSEVPVILSVSFSSNRLRVYTGKKVAKSQWDIEKERMIEFYSSSGKINLYLNNLEKRINYYFAQNQRLVISGDINKIRAELKNMVKSESWSFFDLFLNFIEENHSVWSKSTYKKMRSFYAQLRGFADYTGIEIDSNAINQSFANGLISYYRFKGLKDSSIRKNLDLLKWFMNWCLKKDLVFNRDFSLISFKQEVTSLKYDDLYLNWDELNKFHEFDELHRKEEWCRDIFCFISFSGIRFSKISSLKKENLTEGVIRSEGKEDIILNPFAAEICRKYSNRFYKNNTLFPSLSIITFQKHLQNAARKSGLNRMCFSQKNNEPEAIYNLLGAQTAINTYYAHCIRMGNFSGINYSNSVRKRIMLNSGSLLLAKEKQQNISEQLYESVRSSGFSN